MNFFVKYFITFSFRYCFFIYFDDTIKTIIKYKKFSRGGYKKISIGRGLIQEEGTASKEMDGFLEESW